MQALGTVVTSVQGPGICLLSLQVPLQENLVLVFVLRR